MRKIPLLALLLLIPALASAAEAASPAADFGFASLLPPLIAIALALILRQVLPALVIGVLLGATIYSGWDPLTGALRMLDGYFLEALADRDHAAIIMFSMTLGGMVGIISRCGGSAGIVAKISRFAKTPRSGSIAAWLMGMIIFFDDYANTLIVGNTMRPLSDRLKISREKLSYIVDSTSAPIASIAIVSTWIGFEMGLIGDTFQTLGIERNVYLTFIQTIPYRFYCIIALVMVPMVAWMGRDFGPMLKAERRARRTGKALRDGAQPLMEEVLVGENTITSNHWNALAPILTVILITGIGLYFDGLSKVGTAAPLHQVIGAADSFSALMWAAFSGALLAVILAAANSPLRFGDTMEAFIAGVKSMVLAMIILILAWALGKTCGDLGTAVYVSNLTKGVVQPWLLPALTFVISAFISFATGTSWGTMAILTPLTIQVTYTIIGGDLDAHWHTMLAATGSVLAGSIFGDHCSPISDTTIMSSMTTGSDHIDHVRTQMPYALVAAGAGIAIGDIPAGLGLNPFISTVLAVGVVYLVLKIWGKKAEEELRIKN